MTSVIKYGIIFWGQLYQQWEDFHLQKKIIMIMAGAQPELHAECCLNN